MTAALTATLPLRPSPGSWQRADLRWRDSHLPPSIFQFPVARPERALGGRAISLADPDATCQQ